GPREIGFDRSFIFAATNDRVPTVYIEDQKIVGLDPEDPLLVDYRKNFEGEPTGKTHPDLMYKMKPSHGHDDSIHNGIGRIGFQKGGRTAYWVDENMAEVFSNKALEYVQDAVEAEQPFFLYYALHQPHAPRVPNPRFAGATPLGPRGDVIVEMDNQVGELLRLLRELNVEENTIIVFTSDNGMVVGDGYIDQSIVLNQKTGHTPGGIFRGGKYTRYDGGMHIPLIIQWKGNIKPGVSNALVCQVDFLASFAGLLNQEIPRHIDSQNLSGAFLGRTESGRNDLVLEATWKLSYRDQRWFLIPPRNASPTLPEQKAELYDLQEDPSQKTNLAEQHPEIVRKMHERLEEIVQTKP
ncbi:MAG: sulfatase-like hydrolase/transferase, partial [Planctomycetaceae bacterium]|nr:sulfatase-like hydrolase/transferase [Planctomycetaceae bacterium]